MIRRVADDHVGGHPISAYDIGNELLAQSIDDIRYLSRREIIALLGKARQAQRNPYLAEFLQWKYPDLQLLRRNGHSYCVAVIPATEAQANDPESVIGRLDRRCPEIDAQRAGYRAALLRAGRPLQDRATFVMRHMNINGKIVLDCCMGSYFRALDTCHEIEWELLMTATHHLSPDAQHMSYDRFDRLLELRKAASLRSPNSLYSGEGRSAMIGISVLLAFHRRGTSHLLIRNRSSSAVAIDAGLNHVLPSFVFQPSSSDVAGEFSIVRNVIREYLEELFDCPESSDGEDNHTKYFDDPRCEFLLQLMAKNKAKLYFTGIAYNLLNLRPEICLLLDIGSDEWYRHHGENVDHRHGFQLNREWNGPDRPLDGVCSLGRCVTRWGSDRLLAKEPMIHPDNISPVGAGAFWLGVDALRKLRGRTDIPSLTYRGDAHYHGSRPE